MPSGVGKHHILATPAAFSEPSHIEGLRKGRVDSASVLSAQAGTYHREASGRGFSCGDMVKSCVWASGGFLGWRDFLGDLGSVLEDDSSHDIG